MSISDSRRCSSSARGLALRICAAGLSLLLAWPLAGCMDHFPPDPVQGGQTQPRLAERPQEADTVRGVGYQIDVEHGDGPN